MSKKISALLIALFLGTAALSLADSSEQLITLKDGSQIKGHVSGIAGGVYTVTTPTNGNVQVPAANVASIVNTGAQVATVTQN